MRPANGSYWWKADVDAEAPIEPNQSMKIESLVPWPEQMLAVFRTVGKLIEGRQLRPEHLSAIRPKDVSVIADHEVTVSHIPKARTGGKQGRYVILIDGPRITGRWDILPGEMDRYCREAALASESVY